MAADLGSFVGLGDGGGAGSGGPLAPSPFRLPGPYEEAKERKVAAVSDLRNAVKAVSGSPWLPMHAQFGSCPLSRQSMLWLHVPLVAPVLGWE